MADAMHGLSRGSEVGSDRPRDEAAGFVVGELAGAVALETTLLAHGVPAGQGMGLAKRLAQTVRARGALPMVVGVVDGRARVGMSDEELRVFLEGAGSLAKLNTSNIGSQMFRGQSGATTVSTTMELAAGAGVSMFATGGLGGVHVPPHSADVSADLMALTRFPVAVVCSGVKSILDVPATREALETLGVPVIGFGTDEFPCFYFREHPSAHVNGCDARYDDVEELAAFVRFETARTNRAVMICNPIAAEHEIAASDWARWLAEAEERVKAGGGGGGRAATPALLGALHEVSGGATLRANVELVVANADLAARLAVEGGRGHLAGGTRH